MRWSVAGVAVVVASVAGLDRAAADPPGPAYTTAARVAHLTAALDALRALGAGGRRAFERELHASVRTKCPSAAGPPTTTCMIDAARELCRRRADPAACAAASDVVLTNQHAEAALVDDQTRMRLVRTASDYHAAVIAELRSRYALLGAELALAGDPEGPPEGTPATGAPTTLERAPEGTPATGARTAALAARIDRFCARRSGPGAGASRSPRDPDERAGRSTTRPRDRTVHRCEPAPSGGRPTCVPSLAWQRCAAGLVWYVADHGDEVER